MFSALIAALLGGWVSRLCGGGSPFAYFRNTKIEDIKVPFGLEQWIYAAGYGVALLPCGPVAAGLALLGACYGKRTGHGQYIHLGKYRQSAELDEELDVIVRFFAGVDRGYDYWRCVLGLAITGMAATVVPGLLLAVEKDPLAGVLLAVSGALKGPAYMIGWKAPDYNPPFYLSHTAIGEFLTGFFGRGALACLAF